MKKILMILVAVIAMSATAFAGDRDGRVSFGIGLLYENGLDATLSYERENAYHNAWEFSPTAISNGTNAHRAAMYARIRSGRTTVRGA